MLLSLVAERAYSALTADSGVEGEATGLGHPFESGIRPVQGTAISRP
jgi:hypothetical protein